jgi:hypothetical protein
MKKILFLTILLSYTYFAQSQKKATDDQLGRVNQFIDKIDFLNSIDLCNKEIYIRAINWIYLPSNEDSKQVLRDLLFIQTPEFDEMLTSNKFKLNQPELIKEELMQYVASIKSNILLLPTFEDYYDTAGYPTVKYKEAEVNLTMEIQTKSKKFQNLIKEIKNQEKNDLYKILDTNSKQPTYSMIAQQYQSIDYIYETQMLNWELNSKAVFWVYQPQDSLSKAALIKNVSTTYIETQNNLKSLDDTQINSIIDDLTKLRDGIIQIMELLKTEEDHELALNRLLAEDQLDTEILPNYSSLKLSIEQVLQIKRNELKTILSGNLDEKTEDIKKMVKYNHPLLQYYIQQANPEFDFESLVNKLVPIYSKRFTHQEIKEILKFQNSKIGKKLRKYSDEILIESLRAARDTQK